MEHTATFPGVAPDQVFVEFTSSDFLLEFAAEVGVVSGELVTGEKAGVVTADMPWSFPTDREGIPSLARKLLPETVRLDWHQEWGPADRRPIPGSIKVVLHGTPSATVTSTSHLVEQGADTQYRAATTTKTSLRWPVAGTVESTIDKELVGWILKVQRRVLRRRLQLPEGD